MAQSAVNSSRPAGDIQFVRAIRRHALSRELGILFRDLFGSYRPERHYMRGPGPRWREKHGAPLG